MKLMREQNMHYGDLDNMSKRKVRVRPHKRRKNGKVEYVSEHERTLTDRIKNKTRKLFGGSRENRVPLKSIDEIDREKMVGLGVEGAPAYFRIWLDDLNLDGIYLVPGWGGQILDLMGEPEAMEELYHEYKDDKERLLINAREEYKMSGDDSNVEWIDFFDKRLKYAIEKQGNISVGGGE